MASVNKVILVGRIGKDPEIRYASGGDAIVSLSVATSEIWKDKGGEKQERTEWHRVMTFGKLAGIAGEYLKKGSLVYIEGRLQTRKWTDKSNIERYTTEIVADSMRMLGGKPSGGDGVNNNSARHTSKTPHQDNDGGGFEDTEDDLIPF